MALVFDQEDVLQLVGFHVGPKLFGADILKVREILRDPKIETGIQAPQFVEGLIHLRGEMLPVVDLGRILGLPRDMDKTGDRVWVLVGQLGEKSIGYLIDEVTPIIRTNIDAVFPAPDIILSGVRSKYINGVCETERGLLVVVDLDQILLEDEVKAIGRMNFS